ncbi:MAG TPA: class I SAM-dependent methyltransferase [Candidatus Saccharimonadales bacterium]|nr:class I SAM-dependent methyltransferase [Candidatus Saccharimonadales bacterium]
MSEQYNVFLNNYHTTRQERILLKFNYRVVQYITRDLNLKDKKKIDVLELGVGKGYFAKACFAYNQKHDTNIAYSAFDLNRDMLDNLTKFNKQIQTYNGKLPDLKIESGKKYDVVYCAFVVEHLKNGIEVYELVNNIKRILRDDGLIVLFTPNALSQKFEFFNIDYTHQYPTTSRNVAMAFYDCNITNVTCLKINGLCTYKNFHIPLVRMVHKFIFVFYNYKLLAFLMRPFYRVPLYSLHNFFYQVFCFFKEENLMFIARNNQD